MGLRFAHLHGGDDGETRFADVELPTVNHPDSGTVAVVRVPLRGFTYAEYLDADDEREMIPGLHATPSRHFITPMQGGFEVVTSTGDSRSFGPGDWILFDDIGSKGHLTKRVGAERRVNLVIEVADEWSIPTS
jgi:hypothetical protein